MYKWCSYLRLILFAHEARENIQGSPEEFWKAVDHAGEAFDFLFVQERGGAQPSPWRVVDVDNINCECDEGRIIGQSEERIYIRLLGSFRRKRRRTAMARSATTLWKALTCIRILVF
jgi:hypothetical protein